MTADQQTTDTIRETVRARYAESAKRVSTLPVVNGSCCGGSNDPVTSNLYGDEEIGELPQAAYAASLGCGVPTAVADLHEGETVLDLGSGAGGDVLISARRVGSTGKAIGLDMTDEMLALARANADKAGATNVEFLKGYIEAIPLEDASVDVVISAVIPRARPAW